MEQQPPPTATATATTTASPQVSDPPPPPPPSSQQQPPPSPAVPAPVPSSPNPNPNPKPPTTLSQSQPQPRPSSFSRPWQPPSHFPHFSSLPPSSSAPGPSVSPPATSSAPAPPRGGGGGGGMAIGVPASPSPPQPLPFSSSFAHQFAARTLPEQPSSSTSSSSQVRPPMQGMGMMGSSGSSSQMRPAGIPAHLQQRPAQPSLRPPASPSNQSPAPQNFQGHGLLRGSSAGSPRSPSPNTSQGMQSINQPWLSSGGPHGKPPLPSPSYRAQINPQSSQQRSHIPQQQQHHPLRSITQQLHLSSSQAQQPSPLPPHQPPEHYGQQLPPSSVPQSLHNQQQISRVQGSGILKPSSLATMQPTTVQPGTHNRTASAENDESSNRILSKRSIHELVSQIDPLEKLDPDVEDILVDIAEDFIDSITTFGCSLAKHRKSNMLEAKDILLHLERNWNMSLPGFGGDEIKSYRKPPTNDIHRERLSVIKRSVATSEMVNSKNSAGQGAGNAKSNLTKTTANTFGSPNVKMREAT